LGVLRNGRWTYGQWVDGRRLRGVRALRGVALVGALVAAAGVAAAADAIGPHQRLDPLLGPCKIVSSGYAFSLCAPEGWPESGQGSGLEVRLSGGARFSGGRKSVTTHDLAEVLLENGSAFAPRSGVVVTGPMSRGSIVAFSFAPTPTTQRGYAVWKLPRRTSRLTITTAANGRTATLVAGRHQVSPAAVIEPARPTHSLRFRTIFLADMHHLEAIANGNVRGACQFYKPTSAKAADSSCASAIGLDGQAKEIAAATPGATLSIYNGYVLASLTIGGQGVGLILDHGHFRFPYGYRVI